jgi:hypothetical protein
MYDLHVTSITLSYSKWHVQTILHTKHVADVQKLAEVGDLFTIMRSGHCRVRWNI